MISDSNICLKVKASKGELTFSENPSSFQLLIVQHELTMAFLVHHYQQRRQTKLNEFKVFQTLSVCKSTCSCQCAGGVQRATLASYAFHGSDNEGGSFLNQHPYSKGEFCQLSKNKGMCQHKRRNITRGTKVGSSAPQQNIC